MRLARRFRPLKSNKLTRVNTAKNVKRIAANAAVIKALSEKK